MTKSRLMRGSIAFLDHDELHSMRSRGPLTGEEEYVEDGFNEGPAPFQVFTRHDLAWVLLI